MSSEIIEKKHAPRASTPEVCQKVGTIACALCNQCPLAAFAPRPADIVVAPSDDASLREALFDDGINVVRADISQQRRQEIKVPPVNMPVAATVPQLVKPIVRKPPVKKPIENSVPSTPTRLPVAPRATSKETFGEMIIHAISAALGSRAVAATSGKK